MGRRQSEATQHKNESGSWLPGKQRRLLHGPHVFCAIATWFLKETTSTGDASTARKAWKREPFHCTHCTREQTWPAENPSYG